MDDVGIDYACVAWNDDGHWQVSLIIGPDADSLSTLQTVARRHQGASGAVVLISVADEFFICLRIQGSRTRVLLSDAASALDWPIADEAAEWCGLDPDDLDEDSEIIEPAGDLTLLADLGVSATSLNLLCSDVDLFPDEQIGTLAARIGFGRELTSMLDTALPGC